MTNDVVSNSRAQWWRWPLVPIAAVLAAVLAGLAMMAMQWLSLKFMGGSADGWFFRYLVPLVVAGTVGWAFVMASCFVAPSGKYVTGIVMVTIFTIYNIANVSYTWLILPKQAWGNGIQITLWAIVAVIAAIAGLIQFRNENPGE